MEKGYLALVFHAHLPFVRHPEHEDFLEEDWLYEAITETYIPLIKVFDNLLKDGIGFRITMSLTPTLMSMLQDPLLQSRYIKHLEKLIELSAKEIERTRWMGEFHNLAKMYNRQFLEARDVFCNRYQRNIITAFKKFQDAGVLEVITCAATHGYLPLMEAERAISVRAQIKAGLDTYKKAFGKRPAGIWLPECGYNPGDDTIIKEFGIRYFMTDTHGILFGSPRPKFGIFAPCYCRSGVAAFGRDMESSKSVWSAKEGYPGDYDYREFYRDIGYELEHDYIRPYILSDGTRINTGIKYYKITGETDNKQPYIRKDALNKAADHAGNFMFNRQKQAEHLFGIMGRKPIIVSPYDAELYGHWWFEGPDWINFLIRKIACDQDTIKMISPLDYLRIYPRNQVLTPSYSSWGWKGYSEVWLEGSNDWIYRHLHKTVERMVELASENSRNNTNGITKRALNQAAREVLLAQSSDWAFIMKTQTHSSYAYKRTKDHIHRFTRLYEDVKSNRIDEAFLSDCESKDNIFPDIDYKVYSK